MRLKDIWQNGKSLALFLYLQRIRGFNIPDIPHFDTLSTDRFIEMLRSSNFYLEFGSGGSTVVAANLGIETITVESDRWYGRAVQRRIGAEAINTMLMIDLGFTREWSFPVLKRPTPARLRRWGEYVDSPLRFLAGLGGRFPDLILVDGRFRMACTLAFARYAHELGKHTMICVDDYTDKDWYHGLEKVLGKPETIGRMALFCIDPASPAPSGEAIELAKRDFR